MRPFNKNRDKFVNNRPRKNSHLVYLQIYLIALIMWTVLYYHNKGYTNEDFVVPDIAILRVANISEPGMASDDDYPQTIDPVSVPWDLYDAGIKFDEEELEEYKEINPIPERIISNIFFLAQKLGIPGTGDENILAYAGMEPPDPAEHIHKLSAEITGLSVSSVPFCLSISGLEDKDFRLGLKGLRDQIMGIGLDINKNTLNDSKSTLFYGDDFVASKEDNIPTILIYHSHITETFFPTTGEFYSTDQEVTVARLGELLAEYLSNTYRLPVIHHKGVYDIPRRTAYSKARPVISSIIKNNPQTEIVIDLHRDGVGREVTTTTVDEVEMGKLLLVIGSANPKSDNNYSYGLLLQSELETIGKELSRGVRKQGSTYNQDLHHRSVLVEVGGHENSLEEAEAMIPLLAKAIAETYYKLFPSLNETTPEEEPSEEERSQEEEERSQEPS